MTTRREVEAHLERLPIPELRGKMVPADVLVAYLFFEHVHSEIGCDGRAFVDSMALERFIRAYVREESS